jgi:hypothetical protein
MHPDVESWVSQQGSTAMERKFHADVRALLKSFVAGADFDDDVFLKPLQPPSDGIWEIRITFEPQARIFGAFLRPGEFVATNWEDRKTLATRRKRFAPAVARCRSIWGSLFSNRRRLTRPRAELLEEFDDDGI